MDFNEVLPKILVDRGWKLIYTPPCFYLRRGNVFSETCENIADAIADAIKIDDADIKNQSSQSQSTTSFLQDKLPGF